MPYHDERSLELKLAEHLFWNTDDIEFESASSVIASMLLEAISAVSSIADATSDADRIVKAAIRISDEKNEQAAMGLVRLIAFCSNETPNRFKARFPAYLLREGVVTERGTRFAWDGVGSVGTTLTVEKVGELLLAPKLAKPVATALAGWAESLAAGATFNEFCDQGPEIPNIISRLSARLAQGADTNSRGHGATDLIKAKLSEWGISKELENSNSSDVPVSQLCKEYRGPRKLDTVVYDVYGKPRIISQSQFYTSDVGSIQGKTIEEDDSSNRLLKATYPGLTVLTNTEGFGCHTTMKSRLRHVLQSSIDGFFQLRTMETKLRHIVLSSGVVTLSHLESFYLRNLGDDILAAAAGLDVKSISDARSFYDRNALLNSEARQHQAIKHALIDELIERSFEPCSPGCFAIWTPRGLRFVDESLVNVIVGAYSWDNITSEQAWKTLIAERSVVAMLICTES